MKTLTAQNQNLANNGKQEFSSVLLKNLNLNPMKKLTSVSPFLLLLVPVFVMMLFSFSMNTPTQQEEAAIKTSAKAAGSIIKITSKLVK